MGKRLVVYRDISSLAVDERGGTWSYEPPDETTGKNFVHGSFEALAGELPAAKDAGYKLCLMTRLPETRTADDRRYPIRPDDAALLRAAWDA